jgi:hypothetical protein
VEQIFDPVPHQATGIFVSPLKNQNASRNPVLWFTIKRYCEIQLMERYQAVTLHINTELQVARNSTPKDRLILVLRFQIDRPMQYNPYNALACYNLGKKFASSPTRLFSWIPCPRGGRSYWRVMQGHNEYQQNASTSALRVAAAMRSVFSTAVSTSVTSLVCASICHRYKYILCIFPRNFPSQIYSNLASGLRKVDGICLRLLLSC